MNSSPQKQAILGCLLGTAVGDALGLPAEGMSRKRVAAMKLGYQHRFIFGRGMFSDDTEHTLMLATALIEHPNDPAAMQRALGWKLRWWLLALPAGVGLSTARAILRLWIGFPAAKAGVHSAGNGAAMRSVIMGVVFGDDAAKRQAFTLAACRLTHTDPRAEESALLVAEAASMAAQHLSSHEALPVLEKLIVSDEMKSRFAALKTALSTQKSVLEYAVDIGCGYGVSGFAPNTVAVALFAWLRHRGDFETAVRSVIQCGGDTDTVAAITGAICGAETGEAGIPRAWIDAIFEWPRSVNYIRRVAQALVSGNRRAPRYFWPAVLLRNLFFLVIVILHGFRRMLPPY
ncbi:MAG: ADP-ribosylglycohydrolase family protein [Prosthecobacter sp.]|uniref:ADP-ribosylglycohydrolase family protein n=1 Tax=Prosthecobacter sp. TaxID=1965333 RepID=UPI003BB1DDCD